MGFYVEPYGGKRDPRSATMSRGSGEGDEMQQLFEQLMQGEEGGGEGGEEDFDWEGLWDSFMEDEEGSYEGEGGVPSQGANRPTMFGGYIRPGSSTRPGGGMFY